MSKTEVFKSYDDFLKREDKKSNGVSEEFAKKNPGFLEDNKTNIGCWDCSNCESCEDCGNCWKCKKCKSCTSCLNCENMVNMVRLNLFNMVNLKKNNNLAFKETEGKPRMFTTVAVQFPLALKVVAKMSDIGHFGKYKEFDEDNQNFSRNPVEEYFESIQRHLMDKEWDAVAWNALAILEILERKKNKKY